MIHVPSEGYARMCNYPKTNQRVNPQVATACIDRGQWV